MTELLDGIGLNTQPQFWISVLQIIWINVLLSGDNAIVIALACRNLPKKQRFTGMVLGTGVALLLRLIFATIVSTLMLLPYVKIAGDSRSSGSRSNCSCPANNRTAVTPHPTVFGEP